MPFDGTDFHPEPSRPEPPRPNDTVAVAIVVVLSFVLLAMPLSLAACVDIVRYVRGP